MLADTAITDRTQHRQKALTSAHREERSRVRYDVGVFVAIFAEDEAEAEATGVGVGVGVWDFGDAG
jgi:hypothetical protein